MRQQTLAMAADQGAGFEQYRRRTKREDFLDAMNCRRRSNSDPPRRSKIDPGMDADRVMVDCG